METVEIPQFQVTSYDDTSNKVQDEDDFDKELESFIANRKSEESKDDERSSTGSGNAVESQEEKPSQKETKKEEKQTSEPKESVKEAKKEEEKEEEEGEKKEEGKKEEVAKVEKEEKMEEEDEKQAKKTVVVSEKDTDIDADEEERRARPSSVMGDRKEDEPSREKTTDDEDSEPDDYTLTEDQKRALKEIEYLKSEMGLPEEDPPEYDVKERLKTLNEELANDPTPVEKSNSKVNFKANLVDLVAPPPDYPDEETPRETSETPKTQEPENSNSESNTKTNNGNKVLIEREGKFELVSENDVRAKDLGLPMLISEEETVNSSNNNNNNNTMDSSSEFNRKPAPPSQPRPSTANGNSRHTRPGSSKQRASSAGTQRGFVLGEFNYNSPYAMSPQEKKQLEEQTKKREQRERDKKRLEQQEKEYQEKENNDAFQGWLRQKREEARVRKQREEEEEKKKNKNSPRQDEKINEVYSTWLKSKQKQQKQEKLLKRRQEMESTEGFYIRSRQECDQAFRQWLRQKNAEIRKNRANERQKIKLQRLMARRSRRANNLRRSVVYSDAFRF